MFARVSDRRSSAPLIRELLGLSFANVTPGFGLLVSLQHADELRKYARVEARGRDRADARSRPRQMFWSRCDLCDVSSASHQAACLARSAAAGEALTSLMR